MNFCHPQSNKMSFMTDRLALYTLFFSYFFYLLSGSFYESGGILAHGTLFLIAAISFFYVLKSLTLSSKHLFYYLWSSLFVLNVFGFLLTGDYTNNLHIGMLSNLFIVFSVFYLSYDLSCTGVLRAKDLRFFFALSIIGTVFSFFASLQRDGYQLAIGESPSNVGYNFAFLIPFLFLTSKNKIVNYITLLFLVFFIVQGGKRGAIIVGFFSVLIYFLSSFNDNEQSSLKKIIQVLYVLIGLIIVGYFVYYLSSNSDLLSRRFENTLNGDSSGRDVIYTRIWRAWWDNVNDWSHFLFGYGFASSLRISGGTYAHNDWLELISNFGLVGVTIYFFLILVGYSYLFKKGWGNVNDKALLLSIMVTWCLTSLFSMWYTSVDILMHSLLLGYLMGGNDLRKRKEPKLQYYE